MTMCDQHFIFAEFKLEFSWEHGKKVIVSTDHIGCTRNQTAYVIFLSFHISEMDQGIDRFCHFDHPLQIFQSSMRITDDQYLHMLPPRNIFSAVL